MTIVPTLLTGLVTFGILVAFPFLLGLGFLYAAFVNQVPKRSSATPSPVWQRIVGGVLGGVILIGGISAAGFVAYSLVTQCLDQKGVLETYFTTPLNDNVNRLSMKTGCFTSFTSGEMLPLNTTFFGENWRL